MWSDPSSYIYPKAHCFVANTSHGQENEKATISNFGHYSQSRMAFFVSLQRLQPRRLRVSQNLRNMEENPETKRQETRVSN